MNLHQLVRGAITSVNPDIVAQWSRSTGSTSNADYTRVPTYDTGDIVVQVQALNGTALQKAEYLNLQGVLRSVYCYGNKQGVNRVDLQGGDLLAFPEVPGGTVRNWLVSAVVETWPDWSHVIATLQVDAPVTP